MPIENNMNGICDSTESKNSERYEGIEPERDLLVSYIEDARGRIERAGRNKGLKSLKPVVGIYNWINGYNKSALSFESACEALNLDSDFVRERLVGILKNNGTLDIIDKISKNKLENTYRRIE
jgi:hypothetical protein